MWLNESISNINNGILEKDDIITSLNFHILDLEKQIKNCKQENEQQEDALKKLQLCNQVNTNLEKKIEGNQEIKRQDTFLCLFISLVIFMSACAILKIKSMKKNN